MSDKYQSADLILKLYDLRREEKMRAARDWFGTFMPESAEDIMQTIQHPESSAYYRMVTSYWDMAASFVIHGAIDEAMFRDVSGEAVAVFAKIEPFLAELREITRRPQMYANLENFVMRQEGAREMLASVRERMKHWAAAQAKKD
jgi:hypothetical protein